MKLMEDKRDQLVVIFAGYSDNMREFIQQNPGMRSRAGCERFDWPPTESFEFMLKESERLIFGCENRR